MYVDITKTLVTKDADGELHTEEEMFEKVLLGKVRSTRGLRDGHSTAQRRAG